MLRFDEAIYIMILVFDLDDTLYEEITFVKSGFRAVAQHLEKIYNIPQQPSYQYMLIGKLDGGRGRIFDDVLLKYGVYTKKAVHQCLSVYRHHKPSIELDPQADACLRRLAYYPIYIVTDGNKLVQKNKLETLKLYGRTKFCFRTYQYGLKHSKPSPYCFLSICKRENASPDRVVYIGDNPNKDFVGIRPLGFRTIRLLKGQFAGVEKAPEFEADHQIHSLDELTEEFLEKVFTID
jgi:putative hydrolase of the HAD superfamily